VGLAAGLDKDAVHIDGLALLGFGFLELGTVTPLPQPGNPRPRLFRLPAADALINRFGFNNQGIERVADNVRRSRTWRGRRSPTPGGSHTPGGSQTPAGSSAPGGSSTSGGPSASRPSPGSGETPVIGLNIGKNAATPMERALDDYLVCLREAMAVADYVAINISSPNTSNLRQLQAGRELEQLLGAVDRERASLVAGGLRDVPLLVKIAPDLDEAQVEVIAPLLGRYGIDGVIATNTTLSRTAVAGLPHARETGGLSGRPVFEPSNRIIRALRASLPPGFPIIGAGGVMSAADAVAKAHWGADLVQLYTGLIYRGPALVGECAAALRQARLAETP
jgi:dihydroorotate dehydrogenase